MPMASSGAPQALAHAQQLGGSDAVTAFVFLTAGMTRVPVSTST
jgi:hypothetical protein